MLGALLIYTFYNQLSYNPSLYQALKNIVYKLFYTTNGVIGTPVNVCYTYIVLFIIFGAFLERTGIANFFIALANRLPVGLLAVLQRSRSSRRHSAAWFRALPSATP